MLLTLNRAMFGTSIIDVPNIALIIALIGSPGMLLASIRLGQECCWHQSNYTRSKACIIQTVLLGFASFCIVTCKIITFDVQRQLFLCCMISRCCIIPVVLEDYSTTTASVAEIGISVLLI